MDDKKIQKIVNKMVLLQFIKNILTMIGAGIILIFFIALFRFFWYFAFVFNYL